MLELLELNAGARYICDKLESKGHTAYCVGGCVRDAIMKINPADFDITTSALPDVTVEIFSHLGFKVVKTGIKHGTVTVIYDGESYEITTMRKEGSYKDRRHPEHIEYVLEVEQDLARRDFTINAIAYSYSEKKIIDPFGGERDIKKRIVKAVGNPEERFNEDPLRIMRALRFASRLGFSIEESTVRSMRKSKSLMKSLSAERVSSELRGILLGDGAGRVIEEYYDLIAVMIPELEACYGFDQKSKYHSYSVLAHICKVIDNVPKKLHLRYAALFHDISKPSCFSVESDGEGHFYGHASASANVAENVLSELKIDKATKEKVLLLVRHHDAPIPLEENLIKRKLSKLGEELFFDLIDLAEADCLSQSESVRYRLKNYKNIRLITSDIIQRGECLTNEQLNVNGRDLINVGIGEGKIIGEILSHLLDMVIGNKLNNEKEILLKEAVSYFESKNGQCDK